MKAVFEEVNGDLAVFIVESKKQTYHKPIDELPADAQVNDVFEVEIVEDKLQILRALPGERDKRLETNQKKREELLKRKKNRP